MSYTFVRSGGKLRRLLLLLTIPVWAIWLVVAFIWGGNQGVNNAIDVLEWWSRG